MKRRQFLRTIGLGAVGISLPHLASTQEAHPLELRIEDYISRLRDSGDIASDENTSWSVYDFTADEKLVSINEDIPRQAASMIKPLVVLAFFREVDSGRFAYGPISTAKCEAMLLRSDNDATNWVMEQMDGPSEVQRILSENYGEMLRETDIVEYIPSGGATYLNMASAHDYSRFLYALHNRNLPMSDELTRLMSMSRPDGRRRPNRIYRGAVRIPEGTRFLNKTGTTSRLCGDMGIIFGQGNDEREYPYTIIGIIQKDTRAGNLTLWTASRGGIIREISNIVYDEMKSRYDLK